MRVGCSGNKENGVKSSVYSDRVRHGDDLGENSIFSGDPGVLPAYCPIIVNMCCNHMKGLQVKKNNPGMSRDHPTVNACFMKSENEIEYEKARHSKWARTQVTPPQKHTVPVWECMFLGSSIICYHI